MLNSLDHLKPLGAGLPDYADLDPVAVQRLNRLVRETDAKVVVSSSWRHGRTLAELRCILEAVGFEGPVIGKTPNYVPNRDPMSKRQVGQRGDEIHTWLEAASLFDIEVEQFVILDDNDDMSHLMDRLVLTTMETGLLDWHVDQAVEMLKQPKPLLITPDPSTVLRFTP